MIIAQIECIDANAKNRPDGYIKDCKAHSESWADGTATFTKENWDKLCKKYRGSVTVKPKQQNPSDRCQNRTCGGCAGGPQCRTSGEDCEFGPGTYEQCEIWRMINKVTK